jgi:hypothetical protein
MRIASLEEEVACLKRGEKRRAIPNPNSRFMTLSEVLAASKAIPSITEKEKEVILVEEDKEEAKEEDEDKEAKGARITVILASPPRITRFGRIIKK